MNTLPYNVEIFNRNYELLQHYNVDSVDYKFDYMSLSETVICIPFTNNVSIGDYIRVQNDSHEFSGYITRLSVDETLEGFTNVAFKPFLGLFDVDVMFTVADQGSDPLEDTLSDYIKAYFVNNSDTSQNIYGLEVETISSTASWTFFLEESEQGTGKTIVNLLSVIRSALTKYNVAVYITPNFETKKLHVEIGDKQLSSFTIEADLPSVIKRAVTVNENKSDVNKLIVYAQSNMTTSQIYYLHPDGTYDTTNSNRITPVIYEIQTVSVSGSQTFVGEAQKAADKLFGNNKKENLIEITIQQDNKMVNPDDLEIGQAVTVITNGKAYVSIFTGYEIKDVTKLIFGTIRLDLTKILKEAIK